MWKSSDGRAHTVALSDPTSAMTEEFVRSIDTLSRGDRTLLLDAVERGPESFDELLDSMAPRGPRSPAEDALPADFLRGQFHSGTDVREYLDSIEPQWRLDAYDAVEDPLGQSYASRLARRVGRRLGKLQETSVSRA